MLDFLKYRLLYLTISALVIVPGLISLAFYGLRPSIDFTGGAVWEIRFNDLAKVTADPKRTPAVLLKDFFVGEKIKDVAVSASNESFVIRLQAIDQKAKEELAQKLKARFGDFSESRFETIGPALGSELLTKTIIGVILATILILLYIAYRFGDKSFGICATIATIHDSLVILGLFSLFGHFLNVEVDTLFVTAVLTVLSFSVHDTVVTYDRIRELGKTNPKNDFAATANLALNQTIARSLKNSFTVILVLVALVLWGGATIRWFNIALLIGMVTGTYSSLCVATPLLVFWQNRFIKAKTSADR